MRLISIAGILLFIFILNGTLPARDWQVVQGKWARVEYQRGNEVIADSLLKMAELSIPRLARMHGLPLNQLSGKQVRIILTDAPDITNGYAIDGAVVIYALSSMYMDFWSEQESWYKTVLTHELAHYITFQKIKRKLNIFGQLANLTVPGWFFEGIAQYFAENWNTYRGDIYIKNALLSGKLNYNALGNRENGRLLYASAHAFVRYLATTYGDSSLIKLMSYKINGWYLDFDEAFKSVYKKKPEEAFLDFIREMVLYYGSLLAEYPRLRGWESLPSFGYKDAQIIPLGDSTYVVSAQLDQTHQFRTAFIARIKKDNIKILNVISDNYSTDLVVSPDRRYIAYGCWDLDFTDDQLRRSLRWFIYDRNLDETKLLDKNLRARSAAFSGKDELYLVQEKPDGSVILRYHLTGRSAEEVFSTPMPVGGIDLLGDSVMVFAAQHKSGRRDLFLWRNGRISPLTNDFTDDRRPFFLNDSLIVFNRYEKNLPAVAVLNIRTRAVRLAAYSQDALFLQGIDRRQNKLIAWYQKPTQKAGFICANTDSLLRERPKTIPEYRYPEYEQWQKKLPQPVHLMPLPDTTLTGLKRQPKRWPQFPLMHIMSFALPTYDQKTGLGIYGSTAWMEALYRQMLVASFFVFPDSLYQSLIALQHVISIRSNFISTVAYHGPVFFTDGTNPPDLYHSLIAVQWQRPYFIRGNSRFTFAPALNYVYAHNHFLTGDPQWPRDFSYSGPTLSATINYLLPTRYYPALPKRQIKMAVQYFHSLSDPYRFSVLGISAQAASNLFWEELGLKTRLAYLRQDGKAPPLKTVGIDQYYEFDLPRDYTYTRTIRGLRENIFGDALWWGSAEFVYFLQARSGLKLIALPLNNIAFSLFGDYGRVRQTKWIQVYSYGAELSFGENIFRFGAGYARTTDQQNHQADKVYVRLNLTLPE